MSSPTTIIAASLQGLFDYYNNALFNGELKSPVIIFSRAPIGVSGHFAPNCWIDESDRATSEIAINANLMLMSDDVELCITLIHEMLHLWQQQAGQKPPPGMHDEAWVQKAYEIGLNSIYDGQLPALVVDNTLRADGPAIEAIINMPVDLLPAMHSHFVELPLLSNQDQPKKKSRSKKVKSADQVPESKGRKKLGSYSCPKCGLLMVGKSGSSILCLTCDVKMIEIKSL